MTGSVTVKNGKYYAILNVKGQDGKRRQKWINLHLPEKGNKRAAEKMLRDLLRHEELKIGLVSTDTMMSDYIRYWLTRVARRVDEVTMQGYQICADTQILPWFEERKVKLADIDHHILQDYIDEKYKSGRRDGKGGLSPKSLRHHKNIISQVLDLAVQEDYIRRNPFQFVDLPPLKRFEAGYYSESELKELFAALKDEPILPMIKITALYGLRRSELLGLKWDAIDFNKRVMTIRHTVCSVTKTVAKDTTKSQSSHRSLPLTEDAYQIFLNLKEEAEKNKALFGKSYNDNDYIFKWPDGHPYSPDYLTSKFRALLKKHNLPHIRFYDLRHSCASMLLSNGFDLKMIQEWLGHSDIQVTANVYSHISFAQKNMIAECLQDRFAKQNSCTD